MVALSETVLCIQSYIENDNKFGESLLIFMFWKFQKLKMKSNGIETNVYLVKKNKYLTFDNDINWSE